MHLSIPLPDDVAERLGSPAALSRRALEAFALEEFKAGRLTKGEMCRVLSFETKHQADALMKARDVFDTYDIDDLERDRADLKAAGF